MEKRDVNWLTRVPTKKNGIGENYLQTEVQLNEYIHPNMDLLFIALNAPEVSNRNAHWFSRNLSFWNLIYDSGIITDRIFDPVQGDVKVFGDTKINYLNWTIGVTDLNREVVETNSSNVTITSDHIKRIIGILAKNGVKKCCLMHSAVANAFQTAGIIHRNYLRGKNQYGEVGKVGDTTIYEVPFHNASISDKISFYKMLIDKSSKSQSIANKAETKTKIIDQKPKIMNETSFTLPAEGNSITQSDIDKGTVRITVSFKEYFPNRHSTIKVIVNGNEKMVSYRKRDGRSDLLNIGKVLISELNLKAGGRLKITRTKNNDYRIEKL